MPVFTFIKDCFIWCIKSVPLLDIPKSFQDESVVSEKTNIHDVFIVEVKRLSDWNETNIQALKFSKSNRFSRQWIKLHLKKQSCSDCPKTHFVFYMRPEENLEVGNFASNHTTIVGRYKIQSAK